MSRRESSEQRTEAGGVWATALVRASAVVAVVVLGISAMSFTVGTSSAAAAPSSECSSSPILTNTGFNTLLTYSTSGVLLDAVDVPHAYGDIAMTADGVLYGINFPLAPPTLYTINPATGVETASLPLTGAVLNPANIDQSSPQFNSLSALPDGDLLLAAASTSNIFRVNPITGVTSLFGASFPPGIVAAGDFLSLSTGDLLAVGSDGSESPLYLIHPDLTVTQIGTVPTTFGAAQSGGVVYLAGATGNLMRLDEVPTDASTDPLPFTIVEKTGRNFYGATSVGDAGLCPALKVSKSIDVGSGTTVRPGQTVKYTLTFDNSQGTSEVSTFFTDDLTEVVDDAQIVKAPSLASGAGLNVGEVTTAAGVTYFTISGVLAAGATATVTYSVTVDDPNKGNRVMDNYVIPTGETPPQNCQGADTTCTTNPVKKPLPPKLKLRKEVNHTQVKPGQVIQYRLTAWNDGKGTAKHVMLCDNLPDHLTLVTSQRQLAKKQAKVKSGKLCWKIGTLKPGQRLVRAFAVRVDRDARPGQIVNRATLDRTNVPGIDAQAKRAVRILRVATPTRTSRVTG